MQCRPEQLYPLAGLSDSSDRGAEGKVKHELWLLSAGMVLKHLGVNLLSLCRCGSHLLVADMILLTAHCRAVQPL